MKGIFETSLKIVYDDIIVAFLANQIVHRNQSMLLIPASHHHEQIHKLQCSFLC